MVASVLYTISSSRMSAYGRFRCRMAAVDNTGDGGFAFAGNTCEGKGRNKRGVEVREYGNREMLLCL